MIYLLVGKYAAIRLIEDLDEPIVAELWLPCRVQATLSSLATAFGVGGGGGGL